MTSLERPQKLIVMPWKAFENSEHIDRKNMITLGKKLDFVFMGMSLVIMKEGKHRKHALCGESRFISNGIFLNIFHETWIIGLEGGTKGHSLFSLESWRQHYTYGIIDKTFFSFLDQMKLYKRTNCWGEKRTSAFRMNAFLPLLKLRS